MLKTEKGVRQLAKKQDVCQRIFTKTSNAGPDLPRKSQNPDTKSSLPPRADGRLKRHLRAWFAVFFVAKKREPHRFQARVVYRWIKHLENGWIGGAGRAPRQGRGVVSGN
ncbi:MAG: hypothetical protein NTU80_14025 [Verrucomicrobia bacterium]|nr:hypothetical protein [Verrucomicrobiota bacterium]